MTISHFSSACSHYDVIVRSYINGWYLFWYQLKKDVHSYTVVVNLGLYDLQYWYSWEGCNNPLWKICLGKTPRRTRVKLPVYVTIAITFNRNKATTKKNPYFSILVCFGKNIKKIDYLQQILLSSKQCSVLQRWVIFFSQRKKRAIHEMPIRCYFHHNPCIISTYSIRQY